MAETYLEITQQIEALKQRAESLREAEVAGVIERIRTAIEAYGLTPEQLFATPALPARRGRVPAKRRRSAAERSEGPRFRDPSGNTWSGRGPRPRWLKAALAAGQSLEDFIVQGGSADVGTVVASRARRGNGVAKYHDGEGHSWSGRGPRPGWVKAALEAGKSLDDLT